MNQTPNLTAHLTTIFHQEPLLTGYAPQELAVLFHCSTGTIAKALAAYNTENKLDEIAELEGDFSWPISIHQDRVFSDFSEQPEAA